ncbi:hypothetical protein F994_00024 [Acinetobacter bohemicus ANC 3994]|uniref:Lipoprotein n=1 Tax=Acinetobacter bohemicus ANC 3994 TaxID=1217715 RepID=N8QA04_9GAMM|nr:hypothetical protein [Acinetobacter bohemicus]ENU18777.1 hypothetical protein F994_02913 [Acinetobacter bohemicus ANC 3994]ENU21318.1 hypothetical protein F994_00024 [Acinetobacter bohemicus ANC 3994]
MLQKTLIAMMCSLSLVACGGGGGGSSGSADGGQVTTPASDLDKAKQLVKTTNAIVSYYDGFQNIADQYKVPTQVINDTSPDLSRATNLLLVIVEVVTQDAQGQTKTYTAQQIQDLINQDYAHNFKFKSNNLTVQVTGTSITISGNASVQYWQAFNWDKVAADNAWNNVNHWYSDPAYSIYGDDTEVTVSNLVLEAPFIDTARTAYNYKIQNNGKISTKNLKNQTASFSFTADSTASMVYATAETMENREGIPDQATLKLQGLVFESADVKVTLSELSFSAKKVQFNNGVDPLEQLIPSELVLKGLVGYQQESLNLEAKFNLNNDLSKVIDVSAGQETSTNFINANLNVKLSGNLKGANAAPTPFSIDIAAKRAEFTKGTATVAVVVDKNALDIDLTAKDLDQDHQIIAGVIKHKNGASISIADVDNFTSANIMVSGKSYGTLTKNSSGQYVVKFTDDTITYIAP